ncbi:hypothetical protein ACJX0J_016423, partial [Zea mays]
LGQWFTSMAAIQGRLLYTMFEQLVFVFLHICYFPQPLGNESRLSEEVLSSILNSNVFGLLIIGGTFLADVHVILLNEQILILYRLLHKFSIPL